MIKDPKSSNISSKIQLLIYWIIPFVSCLLMISIFGESLGYSMMSGLLAQIFMGVVMNVIESIYQKNTPNYISVFDYRGPWRMMKTGENASPSWKNLGIRRIVIDSKFLCATICLLGILLDTFLCSDNS